jgi:lysophospholipase L1-like esterase
MATKKAFVLRPHDRIVFLGDSITQQQLYTNYVESYLAASYPELELTFFNAGWGGDTAPGGLRRLERDVLALQPTVVTVCYGMNDGRYVPLTDEILSTYLDAMRELVRRLKAAGVRVVLLTPGMADAQTSQSIAACDYNRQTLNVFAAEVLKLAAAERLPATDIHKLMTDASDRARAADPAFTMIPDGVHPDPAGHLVMAYGILQALGVPPRRQKIAVDLAAGTVLASKGVRADKLRQTSHGFSLEVQVDRLPFFVEHDARKVLAHLPFQETFNSLTLAVRGLRASKGYFRTETGRSTARPREEFESGLDLFSMWNVGPMQRAEAIHRYTLEKQLVYFKLWRTLGIFERIDFAGEAPAYQAGIELVPLLDRARDQLLTPEARRFLLHVVATEEAGEPVEDGEFISQWSCLGPFPKPFTTDRLGGEAAFTARPAHLGAPWQPLELNLGALGNELNLFLGPHTQCFAYVATTINSPVAQEAELLVGSDDGVAVWLNGEQRLDDLNVARAVAPDQERVPVRLRAGANVLLLKISQLEGNWGFCARFAGLSQPVVSMPPTAK